MHWAIRAPKSRECDHRTSEGKNTYRCQRGDETHKPAEKRLRVEILRSCFPEGQDPAPRREETKFCSLWPAGKLPTDRAEVAPAVALRLAGKVGRPWGRVRTAAQAPTAALGDLARATAKTLWARPSCQAACSERVGA